MVKQINPRVLGEAPDRYSYAILGDFSSFLFTAGQVSLDSQGKVIGERDVETQTEFIFHSFENILKESGMDFTNVLKANMYLINILDLPKTLSVRNKYFKKNKPAATTVEVSKLVKPELLVEIEIIEAK